MTNQHDEQTETDDLESILKQFGQYIWLVRAGVPETKIATEDDVLSPKEAKAALEAWSRQQTAQVLDSLKRRKELIVSNNTSFNGEHRIIFSSDIEAEIAAIAALRVGLEGKHE